MIDELNERKEITITFTSINDFKNRIAKLWQDQKDDEIYNFVFPDKNTEEQFNKLMSSFDDHD